VEPELDVPFVAFDHVQLAIPEGGERMARAFFVDVLQMVEIPKPPEIAHRGGCWFQSGGVEIHVGVESTEFRPSRKAHPALVCSNFDAMMAQLQDSGVAIRFSETTDRARRAMIDDPFGNRLELIERAEG